MKVHLLAGFLWSCLTGIVCGNLEAQSQGTVSPKTDWDFGGHAKYRFNHSTYPKNSVLNPLLGDSALANNLEVRLKFSVYRDRWDFKADYQLIAMDDDTLGANDFAGDGLPVTRVISDDRRWWNLTHTIDDSGTQALVQRLDRLTITYTGEHLVWRFGRQAVSWGNGMVFTPMDIFNPFDPAAVDKEYKSGDDMLYGQYLFNNGNDLQAVAVVRRDPGRGTVERTYSSLAFKYHGFLGMNEYDLLVAEHFDDRVLGVGSSVNIGGAVGRGDLTWTDTGEDSRFSLTTSISYSWIWGGKNISGLLEYYYNGFGQKNSDYSVAGLTQNPELLNRVSRGETFTLGRNYMAASATIEINPLLMLTPTFFINLDDPSALVQLTAQYDWKQNIQILAAVNIPVGPDGSEYGGIESSVEERYFSTGPGLFAQLAWYF